MNRDRLTQAIRNNARPDWYRIEAKKDESTAEVLIYGEIGESWWGDGNPASAFVRELSALDVDRIELHLNSPGGDVYDGIAIANAIKGHKAHVVVTVDALAASAASFIATAGDEVVMASNSEMMIHDALIITWGNAADLRETADRLDMVSDNIASMYAEKAGGTTEDWRAAMVAETWYSADEAVTAGLADRVDKGKKADAAAKNAFDLSIFAHAGRAQAPAPSNTNKPPAEPADHTNPTTEGTDIMPDILTSGLRERLGISADAELDDAGFLAAVDEALAERAESTTTNQQAAPGTVVIDEGALSELQASAALGRAAHERQVNADREAAVTNAVNTGRIPAARADAWRTQLAADPGALEVLNSLPENTVPMEAKGYTGGIDESSDDDVRSNPAYKNWSN